MRTVIGEYATLAAANLAVHALGATMSVQSVVVRDQSGRKWRIRDEDRDRSLDRHDSAAFVVTMSGKPENIEQARKLLRAGTPPVTPR
jgi:hypothetical protein